MATRNDRQAENRRLIGVGYRYALSLTHHAQNAEDLIQQACLQVLQQKGQLVGRDYLFAAVRNLFIDEFRKRRHGPAQNPQNISFTESAESHAHEVERRIDLHTILGCLRTEEREALFLNSVEGYTAEEISRLTGQPRGTVLSHLSRAKQRIRERHNADEVMETK